MHKYTMITRGYICVVTDSGFGTDPEIDQGGRPA